ncbi:MAG: TolC family protein [Victivallales bacterium]|jgi:outer membrane protein TolC|nr:TolC family protein [Victivallales bacterium]MBT7164268.1 TolC family protein [Victivallales bacterium]
MKRCAVLTLLFFSLVPGAAEVAPAGGPAADPPQAPAGKTVLCLTEAQRVAMLDHPSLRAAGARVRQAYATELRLRAGYWPQLQVVAGIDQPLSLGQDGEDESPLFSASVQGSWLLFDGLVREYALLAARSDRLGTEAASGEAFRLLRRAVSQAYFAALLAQLRVEIADQDTTFNQQLLDLATKRLAKGMASRSEMLNFEIRTGDAERVLLESRRNLAEALALLEVLLCKRKRLRVGTTELELPQQPVPPTGEERLRLDLAHALAHRPGLLAREEAIQSARAAVGAEKGSRWPRVEAVAAYALDRENSPRFSHPRDASASVGIQIVWDVFDGGARRQRIAGAEAVVLEQLAEYQDAVLGVAGELRQLHRRLDYEQQLVARQKKTLAAAEEDRRLVLALYKGGHVAVTRLNEVQKDFVHSSERLAVHQILWQQAIEELSIAIDSGTRLPAGEENP